MTVFGVARPDLKGQLSSRASAGPRRTMRDAASIPARDPGTQGPVRKPSASPAREAQRDWRCRIPSVWCRPTRTRRMWDSIREFGKLVMAAGMAAWIGAVHVPSAAADTYVFDPGHTNITFSWNNLGLSRQS